jgi:hypothetical protein
MRWFCCPGGIYCVCFLSVVLIDWLLTDCWPRTGESGRRAGSSYLFFMNIYLLVHLSEADDRNYMWLVGRPAELSLPWRRSQLEIPALRLVFDQRVCLLWQLLIKLCWAEWVFYVYTLREGQTRFINKNTLPGDDERRRSIDGTENTKALKY